MLGLEDRVKAGKPIETLSSLASFFLSRIDVPVDPMLEKTLDSGGNKASLAEWAHGQVASAKEAYQMCKEIFGGNGSRIAGKESPAPESPVGQHQHQKPQLPGCQVR
jgi:transaldolase